MRRGGRRVECPICPWVSAPKKDGAHRRRTYRRHLMFVHRADYDAAQAEAVRVFPQQ